MPPHALKWRGKQHNMVMMFEGGVGSDVDRILVILFLPKESYGAEVCCSRQNPYSG